MIKHFQLNIDPAASKGVHLAKWVRGRGVTDSVILLKPVSEDMEQ